MKYADLIRAALDGKKLQSRTFNGTSWSSWKNIHDIHAAIANMAAEYSTVEYREAPPPPVVKGYYHNVYLGTKATFFGDAFDSLTAAKSGAGRFRHTTVKLTLTDGVVTDVQLVKE